MGIPQGFVLISFHWSASVTKETTTSGIETYIKDLKIWLSNDILKTTDDKIEPIVITTHINANQNQCIAINIGDSRSTPTERHRGI